jgi:lipopolysaccharide biosynthesis protein
VSAIRAHGLLTGLRLAPPRAELRPAYDASRWTCYFIYLPDGRLSAAHQFTLDRLRFLDRRLLVVCAAPSPACVPGELHDLADALWWKGLSGFDFSAYALGLGALVRAAPGADVLVLNDSILGPFTDPDEVLRTAAWDITGFTAFSMIENHVQSYAFRIRRLTCDLLGALGGVMPMRLAFDSYREVVYCQETRFARVAAKSASVGALWYADLAVSGDPTLYAGLDLLSNGFPFLKRSLLTRNSEIYPRDIIADALHARGHPLPVRPAASGRVEWR